MILSQKTLFYKNFDGSTEMPNSHCPKPGKPQQWYTYIFSKSSPEVMFDFRENGREGEREGGSEGNIYVINTDWLPPLCTPTGD